MNRYPLLTILAAGCALAANRPKLDPPSASAPAEASSVRTVYAGQGNLIKVSARKRFETLIMFPESDIVLDVMSGDMENWVTPKPAGPVNFISLKPVEEGLSTNYHVLMQSGRIYTFLVAESGTVPPDLLIYIKPKPGTEGEYASASAAPRFVAASAVSEYREQLELAEQRAAKAKLDSETAIAAAKDQASKDILAAEAKTMKSMHFEYRYTPIEAFKVAGIYNNGKFTYVLANPEELPVLHEIKDGKESLIDVTPFDKGYFVPKVLDRFVLSIGKKRMHVERVTK